MGTEISPQPAKLKLAENFTGRALLVTTLLLLAIGAVIVPSALASLGARAPWHQRTSIRHLFFAAAAAVALFALWPLDYRRLLRGRRLPIPAAAVLGAAIILGALVFVPGIGLRVNGCARWVVLGPVRLQPSEVIKLALVVFLAAWFSRSDADVRSFRGGFLPAVAIVGVCVALVITQDLGMAIMIAIVAGATLFVAGARWWHLAALGACGAAGGFAFLASSPRRWMRIQAMLDPGAGDNPCTYQLRQALTAVASGGLTGKGPGMGMMKYGFLPEDSTDFLFAILCEEWGFVGAAALLGVLAFWLLLARRAALHAGDRFGRVLAGSLGLTIVMQAAMHVAVNVGLLPPTGITLPFISAGGTSLLLMATAAAMIVSVSSRAVKDDSSLSHTAPRPFLQAGRGLIS